MAIQPSTNYERPTMCKEEQREVKKARKARDLKHRAALTRKARNAAAPRLKNTPAPNYL